MADATSGSQLLENLASARGCMKRCVDRAGGQFVDLQAWISDLETHTDALVRRNLDLRARIRELEVHMDVLIGRHGVLERAAERACITPPEGCDCAGCTAAAEEAS